FPGEDGESMTDVQHRAVSAVREWNARLGERAVYVICSHGDVIKAVIADSLGMHLDMSQRIQVDPCSLSVIRYTPLRPFVLRMNDTGGAGGGPVGGPPHHPAPAPPQGAPQGGRERGNDGAAAAAEAAPEGGRKRDSDAVIGGGAGG